MPGYNRLIDITGQKFNQWTVLRFDKYIGDKPNRQAYWWCQCSCGKLLSRSGMSIRHGNSKSCGHGHKRRRTHGHAGDTTYIAWASMKARCYNTDQTSYERYGGRGITVCPRWKDSFENFLEDMGERPTPKHQLERKDNSLGYTPANCRWATAKEQARNRRSSKFITLDTGERVTIAEAAERAGVNYIAFWKRLHRKSSIKTTI